MFGLRRDPLTELVSEFNRMQDEFNRYFTRGGALIGGPAINVWSDDEAIYAECDLPAIDPSKLDVSVKEGNQLTIQGERSAPEIKGAIWIRQERPFGHFSRSLTLPSMVDADRVSAKYEHGVLKVTLPKSAAAQPRKISIQA